MVTLFGAHNVWEVVEKCLVNPENENTLSQKAGLRDSRKRDKKALCLIYQRLGEDTFMMVLGAKTPKEEWEKLRTSYKGVDQVKEAFSNEVLNEEVYIEQPQGYEVKGEEKKVLKLKKSLYGLKQAQRAWNARIEKYFQEKNFIKCPYEHAPYIKVQGGDILIVDFIEVKQEDHGILITQEGYAKEIRKKFKMDDANPVNTPTECGIKLSKYEEGEKMDPSLFKSLVGSLRYVN
ncbi:reverse transcriptase [Trifolium pratense]|uniref:Reverse transcriptase n=1 Tax=Trifolium pratense TaxID=57577 RepID=A0A2K3P2N5_TRIPR|nr:reverse transcriptase [Trifolium pratense]